MMKHGIMLWYLVFSLGCTAASSPSSLVDGGDGFQASCGDGGSPDLCGDPVVGRKCGPGNYCPCGYFCPSGTCEISDFHPPCDMR